MFDLRSRRESLGLSQEEVAKKIGEKIATFFS